MKIDEDVIFRSTNFGTEILWRERVLMTILDSREGRFRTASCMARTRFWVNQLDDLFGKLRANRGSNLMFHCLVKVVKGESTKEFHGNVLHALVKQGLIQFLVHDRVRDTDHYIPAYTHKTYEDFLAATEREKVT